MPSRDCRSDDDVHVGTLLMQTNKILRKYFLHGGRRLLDVEHVTAHDQSIGLFVPAPLLQLTEEVTVLIASVVVLINNLT